MIAHISPASMCYEESKNTLNYADRAKNIKLKVHNSKYIMFQICFLELGSQKSKNKLIMKRPFSYSEKNQNRIIIFYIL